MLRQSRKIALEVLMRIGRRGGFANRELDTAFKRNRNTDTRDKALVTEIVYGVLRTRAALDHHLQKFSSLKINKVERATWETLRIALYQILYLDKIPDSAAVNEAVNAVPMRSRKYVNGVLRNLLRGRDSLGFDDLQGDPVKMLATVHSHPEWIVKRWIGLYGEDETTRMLEANNQRPPVTLRANTTKISPGDLLKTLQDSGLDAGASRYCPEAILIRRASDLAGLPAIRQGLCTVQDEAAQAVTHLLTPKPGENILDACAAPGGKTTHIAEMMQDQGSVTALDPDGDRLGLVRQNALRLGLRAVRTVRGEADRPPKAIAARKYDRVLVDAPCSALGLLRKQPEIRWRRSQTDLSKLAGRQSAILEGVCPLVKPGGVLVYSVCTFDEEETRQVTEAFLAKHSEFRIANACEFLQGALAPLAAEDGALRTHGPECMMDGFYAVRLERESD